MFAGGGWLTVPLLSPLLKASVLVSLSIFSLKQSHFVYFLLSIFDGIKMN